jgi:Zn-dependent metalloprotease
MKSIARMTLTAATALLLSGSIALAIAPTEDSLESTQRAALVAKTFDLAELDVAPTLVESKAAAQPLLAAFARSTGGTWEARWDTRSNRPNLIQGSGIAIVPGSANKLPAAKKELEATDVADALRGFIDKQQDLLGLKGIDLQFDPDGSASGSADNTHWFIEFAQYYKGLRVADANAFFRLSHGNIVQFGTEKVADVKLDVTPALSRKEAFALALKELDLPRGTVISEIYDAGTLMIVPVASDGVGAGVAFEGAKGTGYAHRLVWQFGFGVKDRPETLSVLFDAHENRVIKVENLTVEIDRTVGGGIYPQTNTDAEVVVSFPYAALTDNGAADMTNMVGIYNWSGGTSSTKLDGQYIRISDKCGAISSSTTQGWLSLGSGPAGRTDCVTPGWGGAGNTHASRNAFYHLTKINAKARGILTTNTWLKNKLTANMNIVDTCNAFWNGSTVNFFRSGGGCSNTGEIAAVFLHEWGHGLDSNTGGTPSSDRASGEAVGDTFAFLETKNSCIGPNFQPGKICKGCTSCTGVRDVKDFSLQGTRTIAKPANIKSDTGINCDQYIGYDGKSCPYLHRTANQPYRGPMGYEGHCESYIASSANWDLAQSLVTAFGTTSGWAQMDKIWYRSLTPSKSAYRVVSGGQCNTAAVVDGCGSTNWYTVFLAADDNDGNLANGTPNGCRIYDAFKAHGIACGARPACTL